MTNCVFPIAAVTWHSRIRSRTNTKATATAIVSFITKTTAPLALKSQPRYWMTPTGGLSIATTTATPKMVAASCGESPNPKS
eukprot:696662-Pyramimonas_sp.AAC.1